MRVQMENGFTGKLIDTQTFFTAPKLPKGSGQE